VSLAMAAMSRRSLKVFILPYAQCQSKGTFRYAYLPLGLQDSPVIEPHNKIEKYIQKLQLQGIKFLKDCQESNDGTMKRKIFDIYQYCLSHLDPHELFLSHISTTFMTSEIEFIYPLDLERKVIKDDVKEMLTKFRSQNTWLIVGYSCLVPITSLATLLPGPNIFLAGNLLRIYYLWSSRKSLNRFFDPNEKNDDLETDYPIRHTSFVPFTSPHGSWRGMAAPLTASASSSWILIDKEFKDQIFAEMTQTYQIEARDSETLLDKYIQFDKDCKTL
jgi:hypothetical protein